MSRDITHAEGTDTPDPRGQTEPPGGRDRSHDPQPQTPHTPAGGGASTTSGPEQQGLQQSEEARNQSATAGKSRAESGTP